MMLLSFSLFLIITNIDITHSNPIINCDSDRDCYVECNINSQSCQNAIITCPTNGKCDIKCQGNGSCNNATIIATETIGDFNLLCSDNGSCVNMTVYGSETNSISSYDFTVTCAKNERSCAHSTINCPKHNQCNIKCQNKQSCKDITINGPIDNELSINCNGTASCKFATFNGQQSSLLNITGCVSNESCLNVSIYCPPYSITNEHKHCYIEGNNNLNGINIYALNSWNDIEINYIGNDSIQDFGRMHCTNNMSKQCVIVNNNWSWTCQNEYDYCRNIKLFSELSVTNPSTTLDIISTITTIISINDKGPVLNKQTNTHLFSINVSIETILIFCGIIVLLIVCLIGCCCIYRLHHKYNEQTKEEPMDIIHNINIPVDSTSPNNNTQRSSRSFNGHIIYGQSTPSASNNASNVNFNLTLPIPASNDSYSYHPKRKSHTIDIIPNEPNLSISKQKQRHLSLGAYTPTEVRLSQVLRNGIHMMNNASSSSLVPPSFNSSNSSRNISNSLQISSVNSVSPKSPSNNSDGMMDMNINQSSINTINTQIIGNSMNDISNYTVENIVHNSVNNSCGQYLDVRNRNCTLADVNIAKELPLSPPNAQAINLAMDMNVDQIHIENSESEGFEENESDSDLFIQTEQTPIGPQPPPVPKHILANYID